MSWGIHVSDVARWQQRAAQDGFSMNDHNYRVGRLTNFTNFLDPFSLFIRYPSSHDHQKGNANPKIHFPTGIFHFYKFFHRVACIHHFSSNFRTNSTFPLLTFHRWVASIHVHRFKSFLSPSLRSFFLNKFTQTLSSLSCSSRFLFYFLLFTEWTKPAAIYKRSNWTHTLPRGQSVSIFYPSCLKSSKCN